MNSHSPSSAAQPIVIFGGFLSSPGLYQGMREALTRLTGQPVSIVTAWSYDWIWSIAPTGWAFLLRKLERAVQDAIRHSTMGKITLVGHSAGGVMSRLFLGTEPFLGHPYNGLELVSQLITLGSPHYNQRGGWMRRRVEKQYPGAYYAPQIRYGSLQQRWTYRSYQRLCGDGNVWGDGLVPVPSALLQGSQQIVLEGVSHFAAFGGKWYGTEEIVRQWWTASNIEGVVPPSGSTTP
jgi:pimeloyl-ACP methyl ester carboxylesterase